MGFVLRVVKFGPGVSYALFGLGLGVLILVLEFAFRVVELVLRILERVSGILNGVLEFCVSLL